MQGKGLIKVFLVLLTLVCLVQMYYFVPTNKVEKAAENYAASATANITDDREANRMYKEARASYLDSMSSETILSVPLLKDYSYSDLKRQQLALGLDLKGGMSSVLQVDLKELLTALAGRNAKDPTFVAALERADKAQASSESDFVTLFADAFRAESSGKKLNEIFRRSEALGEINTNTTDGEIIVMLREKANETVSLTYNMLKERINRLGVASPNVSLDAARDLILVELAGIDNPKRAREIMSATAQLEFWETYRASDPGVLDAFTKADARLAAKGEGDDVTSEIKLDSIYTPQYDEDGNVVDSTLEVREVTDMFGNTGGPLLSMIELNGASAQYYPTVMGLVDKNKRDAVMTMLQRSDVKGLFPKNSKFMWSYKPFQDADGNFTNQYELYMIKMLSGSDKAPLEGDVVTSASQSIDGNSGQTNVSLSMDARGAKKWAELTTKAANAGNREVAIALDNQVVSAPSVNGPITGGQSSITGNFTVQEAVDFANILEVGKLPAKTKIIQETTVGPSLGQKNINSSLKSLLVGVGLLLVFMVLYYGGAGIVSILALLLNVFFIFGSLSSFGTVLTLPGIAGIVLTIGMAVDANVIIFERVKEELRAGKSLLAAINDGFRNSYSAIIDANVTTILVAIVLAYFGLGPIKGFAVVLIIGVLSSLFTAVLVGRMMIDWWTGKGNNLSFWNGWSKNAFANLNIDWIGKRKIAYTVSGILIIAGLGSILTQGFDLGVEFKGGYSYNIEFGDVDVSSEKITTELASVYGDDSYIVKQVDGENTYNIVTSYLIDEEGQEADDRAMEALYNGVKAITGGDFTLDDFSDASSVSAIKVTSSSKVEPTIADDIKNSSGWAGGFALLLIFLYIFLRFSKWQYSLGAVAALFHDSIIVLGLFSLLKGVMPFALEINQAFIAAILTVIGYSINDTVVVFDRIREYLGIYTNKTKDEVLNLAINSTFSRTIITSLTTLIVVLVLLIFGGGAIKGFAFALLIGILVGTYSSIFVATPIVRDLSDNLHAKKTAKKSDSGKTFGRAKATSAS